MGSKNGKIGIFERRLEGPGCTGRRRIGDDASVDTIRAMSGTADEMFCAQSRKLGARDHDFPYLPGDSGKKRFRRAVSEKLAVRQYGDLRRNGFHVGNDVSRENHEAFPGKFGEEIAETNAFLGVEASRGLVDNQELWIVQQGLRDAHALAHSAGVAAKGPFRCVREINKRNQLGNAPASVCGRNAFDRGEVVKELDRVEIRINAEVLRQIAERGTKRVRMLRNVRIIPEDTA